MSIKQEWIAFLKLLDHTITGIRHHKIQCKDCRYFIPHAKYPNFLLGYCSKNKLSIIPEFYCDDAKPKGGDQPCK